MSGGLAFLIVVVGIPLATIFVTWSAFSFDDTKESRGKTLYMERWNYFKWIIVSWNSMFNQVNRIPALFTRRTPIQKEIRDEQVEIKKLKQQKEDMERLYALKKERDELFAEVNEEDDYTIDPVPSFRKVRADSYLIDKEKLLKEMDDMINVKIGRIDASELAGIADKERVE